MSTRYKIVFLVRFLGYLLFFIGLFGGIFILGPLASVEFSYKKDQIQGVKRTISASQPQTTPQASAAPQGNTEGFGNVQASENVIVPASTAYGIVIEKINANAIIVPGVNPASESDYTAALKKGVAEALGSTPPGQPGNLYLFSHSTDAPWNIIRYNAIFFLLRELDKGDRVIIFYQNKRYDYIVFDKSITSASDVSFLTNRYSVPVLTLQTCDPPGTLINRLIVRAKLVSS